jgi:hypothetical protein
LNPKTEVESGEATGARPEGRTPFIAHHPTFTVRERRQDRLSEARLTAAQKKRWFCQLTASTVAASGEYFKREICF